MNHYVLLPDRESRKALLRGIIQNNDKLRLTVGFRNNVFWGMPKPGDLGIETVMRS